MLYVAGTGRKLAIARTTYPNSFTQEQLAQRLGVDTSSVGRWESQDHIPDRRIGACCEILGISRDWLLSDDDEPLSLRVPLVTPSVTEVSRTDMTPSEVRLTKGGKVAIPMWRGVAAGSPNEEGYFDDPASPEFVEIDALFVTSGSPHVMCVAHGDSMAPRIADRERALVKIDPDVATGYIVVARDSNGRNYIKRHVRGDRGRRELHSVNGDYPPITDVYNWEIRGGVIAILKDAAAGTPNMEYDFGNYLRA
jgi:SOS-response transcriptional repressor LexA/DNA-binding XRE family transcriptional regulator